MKTVLHIFALCLVSCLPFLAHSQTATSTASASASVDIKVDIPPFVRMTDTSPKHTSATNTQVIVLDTSIKDVCIHVVNTKPELEWSVDIISPGWYSYRISDGYSFCSLTAGKQTLTLQHKVNWSGLNWPFQVTASVRH